MRPLILTYVGRRKKFDSSSITCVIRVQKFRSTYYQVDQRAQFRDGFFRADAHRDNLRNLQS